MKSMTNILSDKCAIFVHITQFTVKLSPHAKLMTNMVNNCVLLLLSE